MELLPLDIQIKVLMELPSEDIVRLCQTSKYMQRFCNNSEKYNRLWQHKIRQDFLWDYQGSNGYQKYMEIIQNPEIKEYQNLLSLANRVKNFTLREYIISTLPKIYKSDVRHLAKMWNRTFRKSLIPVEVKERLYNNLLDILS
jgi:hypothetical protein